MPTADPTSGRAPARLPAPLWRFGRRGWIAVAIGDTLLLARAAGFDPFAAILRTFLAEHSFDTVMGVVLRAYIALGIVFDWVSVGSPEVETNLWIAASYLVALTIPDLHRRWIPITLITLVGMFWLVAPFIQSLGIADWLHGGRLSGIDGKRFLRFFMLGLYVQLLLAAPRLRSPRLLVALAVMILLSALWRHGMLIEAKRLGTPEHSYAVGNWLWFAVWYTLLLVWAFRERRRRTPIDPARCLGCGYDLKGLRAATCPECGTEFIRTEDASTDRPPA